MTVLILGNGISRIEHENFIREFPGEVWACNFAYRDFPEKITRLTGHDFVLEEAQKEKKKNGWKFDIYAGVCAKKRDGWKRFTQPPKWHRDSGSTLATQALHEGHDILLCGFDMGGADIYSPEHWRQNKTAWVRRWADIVQEYGADRIKFIGYDHHPFLRAVIDGTARPDKYFIKYRGNVPHLVGDGYEKEHRRRFPMAERKIEQVKIRYRNGYEALVNRKIAVIEISRGNAVEIESKLPPREVVIAAGIESAEKIKRSRKKNEPS